MGGQACASKTASPTRTAPTAANATLICRTSCFVIRFVGRFWSTLLTGSGPVLFAASVSRTMMTGANAPA
jgi:hypothetical protein